jgi:adenosylcobinamide-GDP ribazoletransferase
MQRIRTESRGAIGLLTRLPIGPSVASHPGAAAFGVVGAVMGAIAAVPLLALAGPASEPVLGAIAAESVVVVLSGAMHLDGLADTADALVARDAVAAERARKDPAVGPGGLVAVVLTIAAEVAALASIAASSPLIAAVTLVAAAGIARVTPVLLARMVPSGLSTPGLGSWFVGQVTSTSAAIAALTFAGLVALAAIVTTTPIAFATLMGGVLGLAAGRAVVAQRGIDGDSLGASVEITFVAVLSAVAVAVR